MRYILCKSKFTQLSLKIYAIFFSKPAQSIKQVICMFPSTRPLLQIGNCILSKTPRFKYYSCILQTIFSFYNQSFQGMVISSSSISIIQTQKNDESFTLKALPIFICLFKVFPRIFFLNIFKSSILNLSLKLIHGCLKQFILTSLITKIFEGIGCICYGYLHQKQTHAFNKKLQTSAYLDQLKITILISLFSEVLIFRSLLQIFPQVIERVVSYPQTFLQNKENLKYYMFQLAKNYICQSNCILPKPICEEALRLYACFIVYIFRSTLVPFLTGQSKITLILLKMIISIYFDLITTLNSIEINQQMNKFTQQSNTQSLNPSLCMDKDEFEIVYNHRKVKKLKRMREIRKLHKKMRIENERQRIQQSNRIKAYNLNMNMLQDDNLWDQAINPDDVKQQYEEFKAPNNYQRQVELKMRIINSLPLLQKKSIFTNEFEDFKYELNV